MTLKRFKEIAATCYPDLICKKNDQETENCIDCKGINSLDIASAEAFVLANINPQFHCCFETPYPCQKDILHAIEKSIVYAVLVEKMYEPEYSGWSVKRMVNDFMYKEGLVNFG